jgi:RNA polymerase sigma-70 factor (ECF subfamily)
MKTLSRYLENLTDRRLVGKFLAQRDEPSFRHLYRRHTPALYQLTLRLVGWNVHDAEDVVQETWAKAIERLEAFRWESSLRTYLCGIAINCCRELSRKRSGQHETVLPEEMAASQIGELERIDLEQAIRSLPNGYRQVLVLHDIEGYTHEEISRMLDIEAGTSKSQLSHARSSVREFLHDIKIRK